jgi:hypothetical protein
MSQRELAKSHFTSERFAKVCKAARWNVRAALDLIFIHAEKEVRGRQPRASLNPLTVLSAAAAYERFFDDLYAAAKDKNAGNDEEWEPGRSETGVGKDKIPGLPKVKTGRQWLVKSLDELLGEAGIVRSLASYWEAWMAEGWFGATPTDWTFRKYSEDPDSFDRALHGARHARDGAAHFILPKTAARSKDWYDPIPITDGSLFAKKLHDMGKMTWNYSWDGDTKSDTVQSGFARGITAFLIQLIDGSIVAVANSHDWRAGTYRLPAGWFTAQVPRSDSRYAGAQFWGGQTLHRHGQTIAQGRRPRRPNSTCR